MKNLVANVGINNDAVYDLDDKDALCLNDGFGDIEVIANDGVQHEEDNQHIHFGGPIENEGEQYYHFGGPDQENKNRIIISTSMMMTLRMTIIIG